ncbi:MAG: hypothetical protein AB7K24_27530 [Gemmataceae bacterium]
MQWEYERKEVADRRLDAYLAEKGEAGWELVFAQHGVERRAGRDGEAWDVILKRPKTNGLATPQRPE